MLEQVPQYVYVLLGMAAVVGFLIWKSKKDKARRPGKPPGGPIDKDRPGHQEQK